MVEHFTSATFAGLTGAVFRGIANGAETVDLVLSSCEEAAAHAPAGSSSQDRRTPFSLLFHAPDGRLVDQQTWSLSHPDLGEFPLFLVPLGPDDGGMRYEAVIA